MEEKIGELALIFYLQIIYASGSRAKDALGMLEGKIRSLPPGPSDLDIGINPSKPLTVEEKIEIAIFFEDLFDLPRVEVVSIPEAPVFLVFCNLNLLPYY